MLPYNIGEFSLYKLLKKDSYGEVYFSIRKNSSEKYLVKKINRQIAETKMKKYFKYERLILGMLNHPNILKLGEVIKTENNYFIVMEGSNGDDLSNTLQNYKLKYGIAFPEELVQHFMRQILYALIYIHYKNIINIDLNLKNIMLSFDSEIDKHQLNLMKAKIKIMIESGFSILLPQTNALNAPVGSLAYIEQKMFNEYNKEDQKDKKEYGKEDDIWSLGCICYELFIGKHPFNGKNLEELVNEKDQGNYHMPKTASKEITEFLYQLLKLDGKSRLSAKELMNQPFITKNFKDFTYIGPNDFFKLNFH